MFSQFLNQSSTRWRTAILAGLGIIPGAYLITDIIGAVRWYSPVPFWDMWDYTINFDLRTRAGDWGAFFSQANEHRIVASSVLFWIDNRLFGGVSTFLIAANLVLMTATWLMLCAAARPLFRARPDLWLLASLGIAAPCLSWLQEPNITWGFQSQFFLAYMFPLAAFACAGRSMEGANSTRWFAAAAIFAVASVGTMANGLLAVPLTLTMLLILRASWMRVAIVLVAGGVAIALWVRHYMPIPHDAPAAVQFIVFAGRLLGSPVTRISNEPTVGLIAGYGFIALAAALVIHWLRSRPSRDAATLALLMFLVHISISCAMITFGRAGLEPDPTPVHRYATPTLLGWATLFMLAAAVFQTRSWARTAFVICSALLGFGLYHAQREVFKDYGPLAAHRNLVSALALGLDTRDWATIGRIFPVGTSVERERILRIAYEAAAQKISIFGDPAFARAFTAIGASASGLHACGGAVNDLVPAPDEPRYLRITGWALDDRDSRAKVPPFVYFTNNGTVVGVAATGQPRRDIRRMHGSSALLSGFDGYVRVDAGPDLQVMCADKPGDGAN